MILSGFCCKSLSPRKSLSILIINHTIRLFFLAIFYAVWGHTNLTFYQAVYTDNHSILTGI